MVGQQQRCGGTGAALRKLRQHSHGRRGSGTPWRDRTALATFYSAARRHGRAAAAAAERQACPPGLLQRAATAVMGTVRQVLGGQPQQPAPVLSASLQHAVAAFQALAFTTYCLATWLAVALAASPSCCCLCMASSCIWCGRGFQSAAAGPRARRRQAHRPGTSAAAMAAAVAAAGGLPYPGEG